MIHLEKQKLFSYFKQISYFISYFRNQISLGKFFKIIFRFIWFVFMWMNVVSAFVPTYPMPALYHLNSEEGIDPLKL